MLEDTAEGATPADAVTAPESLTKFGPAGDLSITFVHGPATSPDALERIDRCLRNIPGIDILPVEDLAAYEVLLRKWTVMDVSAVEWLGARAGQTQLLEGIEEVDAADESRFEEVESAERAAQPAPATA